MGKEVLNELRQAVLSVHGGLESHQIGGYLGYIEKNINVHRP